MKGGRRTNLEEDETLCRADHTGEQTHWLREADFDCSGSKPVKIIVLYHLTSMLQRSKQRKRMNSQVVKEVNPSVDFM